MKASAEGTQLKLKQVEADSKKTTLKKNSLSKRK